MKLSKIFMDKKGISRFLEWLIAIIVFLFVASIIIAAIKGMNLNIKNIFRLW